MTALMTRPTQGCNVQPVDPCVTKMVMVLPRLLAAIRAWERSCSCESTHLDGKSYCIGRSLLRTERRGRENTFASQADSTTGDALCGESVAPAAVNVKVFLHLPQLAFRAVLQAQRTPSDVFINRQPYSLRSRLHRTIFCLCHKLNCRGK